MSESKHTPGPWSVPHFAQPDVNCSCGYVLTDHMMGAVATVHCSGEGEDWAKHGDNPNFEQAVANARLIAAAPDLLKALQSVEWAYDARDSEGGPSVWCCPFCDEQKEGGHLDECLIGAALAKAEGL